jgi:protocatechuate 3,4-dioxygenase beta subunit
MNLTPNAVGRLVLALACVLGCGFEDVARPTGREPIVGGPCEGCETVFVGMPDRFTSQSRIAPTGEPGEPMRIMGQVKHADGTPAPGTIVYAYHTNAGGIYPRDRERHGAQAVRHGTLRGWASADKDGRYQFDTIRPGGYPNSADPQHIHMHVIEPGRCTYYIDDIMFRDDPRLTPDKIERINRNRGGPGILMLRRDEHGVWIVERDIHLGQGVPDYPARARGDGKAAREPGM